MYKFSKKLQVQQDQYRNWSQMVQTYFFISLAALKVENWSNINAVHHAE